MKTTFLMHPSSYNIYCNIIIVVIIIINCKIVLCGSYKEQSEGSTDEDDLIDASEAADDAASQDESNAETIEKVLRRRIGRKGGVLCLIIC